MHSNASRGAKKSSVEADVMASIPESCLSVDDCEFPLDYENHKTKTDSNSAKSSSMIEDIR